MASRPALVRLLGDAIDQVARDHLAARAFKQVPPLSDFTLRRFLATDDFRDVEIDIFRDAGWGLEGGFVRIGLRSLVHPVQLALGGVAQSLLAPTLGAAFMPFELSPESDRVPNWLVRGPQDVGMFATTLAAYLHKIALPWLANTESREAVLGHLEQLGFHEQKARLQREWAAA